jgi:hypothetical protein
MADHNGNSFEMGRMWGLLQANMEQNAEEWRQNRAIALQQNEILIDIKDTLTELPQQIASRIATPASATPSRILPEVSELFRSVNPALILMGAILGKALWPTEFQVIRLLADVVGSGLK